MRSSRGREPSESAHARGKGDGGRVNRDDQLIGFQVGIALGRICRQSDEIAPIGCFASSRNGAANLDRRVERSQGNGHVGGVSRDALPAPAPNIAWMRLKPARAAHPVPGARLRRQEGGIVEVSSSACAA